MRTLRIACVVVATSMLACGGDDPVAYDDLPAALADALCSYSYRCCDATELDSQFGAFDPPVTDEASCRVTMTAFYEGLIANNPSVASGRLRYDGEVAARCVSDLRGATCGTSSQVFRGTCDQIFVGAVAAGGTCAESVECASGLCDRSAGAAEGTCATPPTAGMACIDGACADSAYCEAQQAGGELCVARLADGALCATSEACASGYCDDAGRCGVRPTTVTCDGV